MFRPAKKLSMKNSVSVESRKRTKEEIAVLTHGLIVLGSGLEENKGKYCPRTARSSPAADELLGCCSSATVTVKSPTPILKYTWEDEEDRRGGISYERADKNAIYVRALGDGRMRGKTGLGDASQLMEWERKLIEKLSQPDCRMRFRSRFLSLNRVHRRRRPNMRLSRENKQSIDESYYLPAQLLLQHSSSWDFDVFHLDTLTGGRSLLHLAYHIFREYGFIQRFRLDPIKLLCFFSSIEDNYHDSNPYHNIIHSSDVTQAMYCYLQEEKLLKSVTPFEAMMAVIAAMAHDLDHPGVNQTFLVATANHLATLYQNTSVLEMHHWRYGVGLMQECGIFSHFTHSQWATAIWQFRSLILATDITRQQEFLLKFRRMIDEREFEYESNLNARHFVLQIALKCADICNPCRKWYLSEKWSRQVCEEFFRQGDMERQVGVPVTPVCDRHANTVAKIQIGFMEVVVRPLFMEWKRFLPTDLSAKMLSNILLNKQKWQTINEKEALSKAAALAVQESEYSEETLRDGNRNNATASTAVSGHGRGSQAEMEASRVREEEEEVMVKADERPGEEAEGEDDEEGGGTAVSGDEREEEEEGHGEEADTVENDINLAFHYQTDSEQASESGSYSLATVSEEEQLMLLARNSRRRHSMPVVIRKDLGFYMGLRQDLFPYHHTHFQFQRRQSLPATSLFPSSAGAGARAGDSSSASFSASPRHKDLSMEGLLMRPKISNLSSSLDTRVDYLSFLPLQSQTRLLQRGAAWGDPPNVNDLSAAAAAAAGAASSAVAYPHPHRHHHQPPSASFAEMRRSSHGLKEDAELVRMARGDPVAPGSGQCQRELVGLASSWPSILHGGQHADDAAALKRLADRAGLTSPEADLGSRLSRSGGGGGVVGGGGGENEGGTGGGGGEEDETSSSSSNNNVVAPACLSASQVEGVSLLSRPH